MKVVFLDVDGVLASRKTCLGLGDYPTKLNGHHRKFFDWAAVGLVRLLCEKAGASVVISSTWRRHYKAEHFKNFFDLPVIGCTPTGGRRRGDEISRWIEEWNAQSDDKVTHWVTLDDNDDFWSDQHKNWVNVDASDGLGFVDYAKALMVLGVDSEKEIPTMLF